MVRSVRSLCLLFLAALLLPLWAPPASASPVPAPLSSIPTVDGDILASAILQLGGTTALAIGGSFAHVRQANGTVAVAQNLAVIRVPDGALLYAGHANSYVRALYAWRSRLYIGGDFTALDGKARNHIASVYAPGWTVTPFAPAPYGNVQAITGGGGNVIYGGGGSQLRAAAPDTSTIRWALPSTGGPVRTLLTRYSSTSDSVYVGGLFEKIGTTTRHGLQRLIVRPTSAAVDPTFHPILHADSNVGPKGSYDGQCILSLAFRPDGMLMVGWGGATSNGIGAMNLTGAWLWWRLTPGDVQATVVADDVIAGYHRGHTNSILGGPHGEDGQKYYATEFNVYTGTVTPWDSRLAGSVPSADGGNGGVQASAVDTVHRIVFLAGAFSGTATCSGAVFPCRAPISSRKGLAGWSY